MAADRGADHSPLIVLTLGGQMLMLGDFLQDVRHAARALRRSPAFTATALATLAIGIGVDAAVFTVTNAVLFKGFALVRDNDRLVYIGSRGQGHGPFVSYPDFEDWRTQARSFEGMSAVAAVRMTLSDDRGFPESSNGTQVTANTFALLGQQPIIGRDFTPADEVPGAAPVVILSDAFWERRYGRDPAVLGHTLGIDGMPATVIGVMPPGFAFPRVQDLWMPLVPTAARRAREVRGLWFACGRLREGVTLEQARAELDAIGRGLAMRYPRTNRGLLPSVRPFDEFFTGPNAKLIYGSLMGAVSFVLLIACANLANLLLGRAIGRSREVSVRLALGAGRWRIVRQALVESAMLSLAGGALGALLAMWSVRAYALAAGPPGWFDRALDYTMDHRVLAYLAATSIGAGMLFGLAPIARLSAFDLNGTLKNGGRGTSDGERGRRLSVLLVVGEMALAFVLLAGAGVMTRSLVNVYRADLGVATDHVLAAFIEVPAARYPDATARVALFERLQARVKAMPGVEAVGIAARVPTQGAPQVAYEVAGASPVDPRERPRLSALIVGSAYFHTIGAHVVAGREFTDADDRARPPVAIVNERFANDTWPAGDALGKRLRLVDDARPDAWLTVVGVVSNIVQSDIARRTIDPLVYVPHRQAPAAGMWVLAQTRVPPATLATQMRREIQSVDPDLPVFRAAPLTNHLAEGYRQHELFGGLFVAFAAIALLLASSGLYAVVAHAVGRRTQEIGIRAAMGATARDVLSLVIGQSMVPVGIGLAVGVAASLAIIPVLQSMLVHVSPLDPVTFAVASMVLIAAALLGCLVPACRAARVDPLVALRHE